MFSSLQADIRIILERDPAARSTWEVLTCYPGLHALALHRRAHWCWTHGLPWLGRFVSHLIRWFTGIEIHPGARIAPGVFIDHGMGVVIGETAEISAGCTIYQGVTLGGTRLTKGAKRHPTLGRDVVVGAGAKVLGGFVVGDGAKIGSNAVVTKPVPAGATAVGNPARIVGEAAPQSADAAATVLQALAARAAGAAASTADRAVGDAPAPFPAYGVTAGDDPVGATLRGLIDSADGQEQQIALLWQAIAKLSEGQSRADCVPGDAACEARFEAERLKSLIDK
ncbi:MAG: Serine acetyltransferase [Paracidovorax wautersii]|uniref:Serine acetyltransferase n=1 Tax=Paracidovorax wautersii TaxID=1177982 RepID=A0A7V8FPG5_9BURK|nr:MAG: Serine acetyltransferase [Paracidovorax wautersii]